MANTKIPQGAIEDAVNEILSEKSLGIGQTITDVLASRALATTYTNSTGKPIFVVISQRGNSGTFVVDGITLTPSTTNSSSIPSWFCAIVPDGITYSLTGGNTPTTWVELR